MKKRIKRFGAFALLVLAGLMFAGCSKSDSSKNQESDDKSFFGGRNPIDELLSFVDDLIPKYAPQDTPILGDWNSQNGLYSFRKLPYFLDRAVISAGIGIISSNHLIIPYGFIFIIVMHLSDKP